MEKRRQYTASAYTIDFSNHSILLMYNAKLNLWLQPGGHILDDELEMPWSAAERETMEETGVPIQIIGPMLDGRYQPVAVEHYSNSVGDMIDIQYLAIPISTEISVVDTKARWQDIFTIDFNPNISLEIKNKAKELYKQYKNIR